MDSFTLIPHVKPATQEDVESIASRIRQADREELRLCSEISPLEAIQFGYDSAPSWVLTENDSPEVIFGVVPSPQNPAVGIVWMLATDAIENFKTKFIRTGIEVFNTWADQFDLLLNYVHAENTVSIRWLKHAGFTVHPPEPYGLHEANFHLFTRSRQCVIQ